MAPPKGKVPPQLRPYLFRKGEGGRTDHRTRVVRRGTGRRRGGTVAKKTTRRRVSRKKRRRGPVRMGLVPTLIATTPDIQVGVHAAIDLASGVDGATAGRLALTRFQMQYTGYGDDGKFAMNRNIGGFNYGPAYNYGMKVAGLAARYIGKKVGLHRIRLSRRWSLF